MPIFFFFVKVHQCYGDELGLTTDDEDYIAPGTEDDKLSASIGSFSEVRTKLVPKRSSTSGGTK